MDRLISLQAAIDAICKEGTRLERNGTVAMCEIKQWCIDLLERLPSAQPEPQWIPCSERLPAYGEDVLISIGGCCNVGHIVPVNEEEQYNWYFSGWYHLPNDVDAWMPLPEPWKGEQNERK